MKTKLHYYLFDLNQRADRAGNTILQARLKADGLQCVRDMYRADRHVDLIHVIKQHAESGAVELSTVGLLPNKWHALPVDLYNWFEFIHKGRIKEGYYLEQTAEMIEARDTIHKCPRCWLQYDKPQLAFCMPCVMSDTMIEHNLHTAFLRPVSMLDVEVNPKNILIPKWIKDKYDAAQLQLLAEAAEAEDDDYI